MKKKLLYFMFAAVALCVACGDEDETFQREGVENPVTGISIENEFLENGVIRIEGVGTTTTLQINVTPESAEGSAGYSFRFSTSDAKIFTVNREGTVVGVAPGEAELTVTVVNDANVAQLETKCRVKVIYVAKVEKIEVADGKEKMILKIGDTYDLGANLTVLPDDAVDKSVSYVLKEGHGIISLEDGVITALDYGKAVVEITANDGSGVSTVLTVTVKDIPDSDVYLEFGAIEVLPMGKYLILNFSNGDSNNKVTIALNQMAELLPGEYSKTQMYLILSSVTLDGSKRNLDTNDPGSFTVKYNEETNMYSITGVLKLKSNGTSVNTVGFDYSGSI